MLAVSSIQIQHIWGAREDARPRICNPISRWLQKRRILAESSAVSRHRLIRRWKALSSSFDIFLSNSGFDTKKNPAVSVIRYENLFVNSHTFHPIYRFPELYHKQSRMYRGKSR